MANTTHDSCDCTDSLVSRPEDLALSVPTEEAPGAEQVHAAAVSVAVTYPDWRREELARKYSDEYREEQHERSFYHPYD